MLAEALSKKIAFLLLAPPSKYPSPPFPLQLLFSLTIYRSLSESFFVHAVLMLTIAFLCESIGLCGKSTILGGVCAMHSLFGPLSRCNPS